MAAPSANRSTRVSPTTAAHVREELGTAVDLILDGGPCRVGIESTVLDLSTPIPVILRPGAVTRDQIEDVIGPVALFSGSVNPTIAAASPGQHAIHYAPRAPAYRYEHERIGRVASLIEQHQSRANAAVAVLRIKRESKNENPLFGALSEGLIEMPNDPAGYARRMYAALREADGAGVNLILVEMPSDTPEWAAIRDRLTRATQVLL